MIIMYNVPDYWSYFKNSFTRIMLRYYYQVKELGYNFNGRKWNSQNSVTRAKWRAEHKLMLYPPLIVFVELL